jgi:hypothetical protein
VSAHSPGKEIVDKYGQQMPQYTAKLMAYYSAAKMFYDFKTRWLLELKLIIIQISYSSENGIIAKLNSNLALKIILGICKLKNLNQSYGFHYT